MKWRRTCIKTNTNMRYLYLFGILLPLLAACGSAANQDPTAVAVKPAIPYDSLKTVLANVHETDQGIREKMAEATTGEEQMLLMPEMERIDSANQATVEQILNNYGWLPQSEVGEDAARTLFLVVQHSRLSFMQKYFPLLKQRVAEGEASNRHAAMMEDRMLMWQGKKQIYGSQASNMVRPGGEMLIWPIEDVEKVNARRSAAGFPNTIEAYAESLNAVFDPNVELPAQKAQLKLNQ